MLVILIITNYTDNSGYTYIANNTILIFMILTILIHSYTHNLNVVILIILWQCNVNNNFRPQPVGSGSVDFGGLLV